MRAVVLHRPSCSPFDRFHLLSLPGRHQRDPVSSTRGGRNHRGQVPRREVTRTSSIPGSLVGTLVHAGDRLLTICLFGSRRPICSIGSRSRSGIIPGRTTSRLDAYECQDAQV